MVNGQQLKLICPTLTSDNANRIAAALDEICPKYGINKPDIFHEFIANLAHESSEFSRSEENLKYTTARRIMAVWPYRFKTEAEAAPYTFNPQKLAEKVYGKRADLGNVQEGDGWMFRGGGPIQTTGRKNHTDFCNFYNKMMGTSFTPEQIANLIRTNLEVGIHSACWIFAIAKKLIDEAENDQVIMIRKRINGGLIGLPEVMQYYNRAVQYII